MKDNEGESVSAIGKKLGEMWKKVSDSERASFEKKAASQKAAYASKLEKYMKSAKYRKHQMNMLAWKIHETKKPFKKDENMPKKAPTAYMLFAASVRAQVVTENPDMSVPDVMRKQADMWKEMDD